MAKTFEFDEDEIELVGPEPQSPTGPGTGPTGPGTGPTGPGTGPTGPGTGPTGPGTGPTGPGTGPTGSGTGPTGSRTGPTGSGTGPTGPGTGPTGSGTGPTGSGTGPTGSGTGPTGSGTGPSGPTGTKGKKPTPDEIDEKIRKELENRNTGVYEPERTKEPVGNGSIGQGGRGVGTGGDLDLGSAKKRVEKVLKKPMNWKQLIRQMISSSQLAIDTSYLTPSKSAATQAAIGADIGAAPVKPGERTSEEPVNKVLFSFDSSGSMWQAIPVALKEAQNLLSRLGKVKYPFGVMFWAGEYQSFVVNQGLNYYAPVSHLNQLSKPVPKDKQKSPWTDVLSQHGDGGTDFTASLVSELKISAVDGYNIMIFSDEGIMERKNWANFMDLYSKNKRHVFFIADSQATYEAVCLKLGSQPPTFSHLFS